MRYNHQEYESFPRGDAEASGMGRDRVLPGDAMADLVVPPDVSFRYTLLRVQRLFPGP